MPAGPGKYDDVCVATMEATGGSAVVLIVINGHHGSGFSVNTVNPAVTAELPALLEQVAKQIRETVEEHTT